MVSCLSKKYCVKVDGLISKKKEAVLRSDNAALGYQVEDIFLSQKCCTDSYSHHAAIDRSQREEVCQENASETPTLPCIPSVMWQNHWRPKYISKTVSSSAPL